MRGIVAGMVVAAVLAAGWFGIGVSAADKESEVLRHVVLFKYKEGTTPEQIQSVHKAFLGMKGGIEEIVSVEGGSDVSPEGLQHGFTHAFIVTFKDEADRDAYLVHPVHKDFVKLAGQYLAEALAIDFVPTE